VAIGVSGDGYIRAAEYVGDDLEGPPLAIITQAAEWRSVCKPTELGNPARLAAALKAVDRYVARMAHQTH
jgi:hypothetical protein